MGNQGPGTAEKQPAELSFEEQVQTAFGLTPDEIKDALDRSSSLEERVKLSEVESRTDKWSKEGVPPAVVGVAKEIMLADDGGTALLLSEEGAEMRLTASQIVDRVIAQIPRLDLEDKATDRDQSGKRPLDGTEDEVKLSHDEAVRAAELQLDDHSLSDDDAIAKAKAELGTASNE